ncbi:MAG TPA: RusA family crossover junction endodeoxyribonuclease [Methylophilaceae bacterium]
MSAPILFCIPGEARGKGRPRFARRGNFVKTYTDAKTASFENLVAYAGNLAMQGRPPLAGAVAMQIKLRIIPPASWSKKKREAALAGGLHPTSKPDLDNVAKAILDALNGICFIDDKQVISLSVSKSYAEAADAMVSIEEVA